MKKIIMAKNLYKTYGEYDKKIEVLSGINMEINEGEFVGIMGSSGSGKSTLINILSTLDYHTKGELFINNLSELDVRKVHNSKVSEFRKWNVGFIFQNYNLLDEFTNKDNIKFPLILAKFSDEKMEQRIEKLAKILEIEDILDKRPMECSGGQKQRVAIARALSNNPKIIFADEPTDSLDAVIGLEVLKILKKLNEEEKITIVLVTHNEMMASFCEKVFLLEEGKIQKELINKEKKQIDFYNKIVNESSRKMEVLLKSKN